MQGATEVTHDHELRVEEMQARAVENRRKMLGEDADDEPDSAATQR